MYTVSVKRDFIARHFLTIENQGPENDLHSHHYQVELQLQGDELDQHGYLVDILEIERVLETLLARYRDSTLNQLPGFAGLNPSIEHFSRILCQELSRGIQAGNIRRLILKLWENEIAWASYQMDR